MFNIPVGVYFSLTKKKNQSRPTLFISLYLEIRATSFGLLWLSSGCSKKTINIETLVSEKAEGLPLTMD
jgi:hypothetical protein